MNWRYLLVEKYLDRISESVVRMRESPRRIAAIVILTIIIFSILVALLFILSPKENFQVECIQCGGRDGNLVIMEGTNASFDIVVKVSDDSGNAVENATVKIYGGDEKAYAKTGADGIAVVKVNATLEQGEQSGFLKVVVEKSGFRRYTDSSFVVLARE